MQNTLIPQIRTTLEIARASKLIHRERNKKKNERESEGAYRLVEGPLLQQILVQRHAMIPITTKISVVTKKPMSIRFPSRSRSEKTNSYRELKIII